MNKYPHSTRILVALDCIVFGFDGEELKLLLIKRNFEPEQGKWSLMGGFLEEEEDLEVATNRILYDLTGLKDIYFEEIKTFGKVFNKSLIFFVKIICEIVVISDEFNYDRNLRRN